MLEVSEEVQIEIDRQNKIFGEKLTSLMAFLYKSGRGEDIIKASTDTGFLNKLLVEFSGEKVITA